MAKASPKKVQKSSLDPKRERVVELSPGQVDNTRYQPRTGAPFTSALKADIERSNGNIQPVLLQDRGHEKPATVDGHRRVRAISAINQDRTPKTMMMTKCVILPMSDRTAALSAIRANSNVEPITDDDRDAWAYKLVFEFKMPRKEVMEELGISESHMSNIMRAHEKTIEPIRELLEKRRITVHHAKAVASLRKEDQKKVYDAIRTKPYVTVSEVESRAKHLRERREAIRICTEYFKGLNVEEFEIKDEFAFHKAVWGDWRHGDYLPRDYDVKKAAQAAGVTLIHPTAEASHKAVQGITTKLTTPQEPEVISVCFSCRAYNQPDKVCIHPNRKAESGKTECDLRSPGKPQSYHVCRCPFCDGLTLHESDDVHYVEAGNKSWDEYLFDDLDTTYWAHMQCVIDAIIKSRQLTDSGPCLKCQQSDCELLNALNGRDGLEVTVIKCDDKFEERVDLEELNKWAYSEYAKEMAETLLKEEQGQKVNNARLAARGSA